jgi:hypothetical protein
MYDMHGKQQMIIPTFAALSILDIVSVKHS